MRVYSHMTSFDPAPEHLHEVTSPAWLGQMLGRKWPGARVTGVEVVELLATQATKVRLKLEVECADTSVPTQICIKGVLTDTGAVPSASIVETLFYREAASGLPVRVPGSIHASLNADGKRGVVVMHDIIAAGGKFCSALESFTPEQAVDGLDQLARLHAASQPGSISFDFPWARSFLDMIAHQPILPHETLQNLLDGPRGDRLSPAVRDAGRLLSAIGHLAAEVRSGPLSLVHGDAHAGNMYHDAEGLLGLVDWQVLQKGSWAQAVAYHLSSVLTPEDRRQHERRLLEDYCHRLRAHGGIQIDSNSAWRNYRTAIAYGFYMWAITRKVEPTIINEFVYRLGTAADDLESFDLLGC